MFTEPKIITNGDLKSRSYISFYYQGVRYREYNGKKLGLEINPNYAKTLKERSNLLINLQYEIIKALKKGWSPVRVEPTTVISLGEALKEILDSKIASNYSKTYKRDLEKVHNQFIDFIPQAILELKPSDLKLSLIESFLDQFKSSNRNYMNKRGALSVYFSEMIRKELIVNNPISRTIRAKAKSVLHEVFSATELTNVLDYLKIHYTNLHLCCLLTYACFLRPHKEVRLLKLGHLHNELSEIHLSGSENKSGRIRTVFIPPYIQRELKNRLEDVENPNVNVFTLEVNPFNDDYVKTQWSRAKSEMLKNGLIRERQTLYSFRHTGAVNVYKKTKDLHIIQQLLGHSDMIVTMNYLRGLGVTSNEDLKNILPEI
jgi:integrase